MKFSGFEQEVRGPWNPGRYSGVIVREYETTGNFAAIHRTEDRPSQDGSSRNLKLCVTIVNGKQTKNLNYTVNYRPEIFDDARLKELKELLAKYKGQQQWPDRGAQRDALSATRMHELEKAGIPLEVNGHGIDIEQMLGKAATFRVNVARMKPGAQKESETVPKEMLSDPNTTDEEKARWFNKITAVFPGE